VVGATLRSKLEAGAEVGGKGEQGVEAEGVPLTITPLQTSINLMQRRVKLGRKGLS